MTIRELSEVRENYLSKNWEYKCCFHKDFTYPVLKNCIYRKSHKFSKRTYNDITIMIDTETSKPESIETDECFDIYNEISSTKFKWQKEFNGVAKRNDFTSYNLHFGGASRIDVYYETLKETYPWIFKENAYSDIQALEYIYEFMCSYKPPVQTQNNIVVIWTLSINLFNLNICTLYGRTPSELMECIKMILDVLEGDITYMYIFNLPYDYVFLRKFLIREFGFPIKQLNVKPYYPVSLEYQNGLILKDALILAQRKLSKWAEDMCVEHQKAIGDWDYKKVRHQNTPISDIEIHYAEFDTLAGVECIDALKNQLNKDIGTMPLTSTGILREIFKKVGAEVDAKKWFNKLCPSWEQYQKQTKVYHGGFAHGNRHYLDMVLSEGKTIYSYEFDDDYILGLIMGGDFASSFPFSLFKKYPSSKFTPIGNKSIKFILDNAEDYAFMFKLIAIDIELKDDNLPMPFLQASKCVEQINSVVDNGRIIASDYVEIYLNEIDLDIINQQYKIGKHICVEVEASLKDYLPRWFTDIVFELFKDKTLLKGVDKVLYNIQKYKLNACYGLCCQRWDKPELLENEDGEYLENKSKTPEDIFNKHIKKYSTILPYFIGAWCTSHATQALFRMGAMCDIWLYSDTDSCYGVGWDMDKVKEYNDECIKFIESRGYGGVWHEKKNRYYYLGVIEFEDDSIYTEFRYMGAKRYCGRCKADNKIHITVAGVPKEKGAECLNDDIKNFHKDFIFEGEITGKLQHTHVYVDDIYINEYSDEVGDSIDLSPCDYQLDVTTYHSLIDYINSGNDVVIQIAEDVDDLELIY